MCSMCSRKSVKEETEEVKLWCITMKCTFCAQTFPNVGQLSRHRWFEHKETKVKKCKLCGQTFPLGELSRHRSLEHPDSVKRKFTKSIKALRRCLRCKSLRKNPSPKEAPEETLKELLKKLFRKLLRSP